MPKPTPSAASAGNRAAPEPKPAPAVSITTFVTHRRMVICLFISTIIVVAALAGTLLRSKDPSALVAVGLTGALGGFMSALQRYYTFGTDSPGGANVRIFGRSISYVIVYSLIPPLIGLISALVLYVVFAARMVTGGLFPAFNEIPDPIGSAGASALTHFQHFLNDWKPDALLDYAKVLVWGFIAGFSERLVPDLLGKLSEQARTDNDKAAART